MDPVRIGKLLAQHREALGLTQDDVAEAIGVSQKMVSRLERGGFKRVPQHLAAAAAFLKIDQNSLGIEIPFVVPKKLTLVRETTPDERNFPIYGATRTKDGIVLSGEHVALDFMPGNLSSVRDAYGILIPDDTMRPAFAVGDTALVDPHLPPVPGVACLFRTRKTGGNGLVRTLVRETDTHWVVEQYNPAKQAKLPKDEWPICHRTVGRYDRR